MEVVLMNVLTFILVVQIIVPLVIEEMEVILLKQQFLIVFPENVQVEQLTM